MSSADKEFFLFMPLRVCGNCESGDFVIDGEERMIVRVGVCLCLCEREKQLG